MPTRFNPMYIGGGGSYGSRLTPATFSRSNGGVPQALALAAGMALDAATYDPAMDPRVQSARYNEMRANQLEGEAAFGQELGTRDLSNTSLGDIAGIALRHGISDPKIAGGWGNVQRAVAGPAPGQSMDDYLVQGDPTFIASGGSPSSTMSASTYTQRTTPEAVMTPQGPRNVTRQNSIGMQPVLDKSKVEGGLLSDLITDGALNTEQQRQVVGANPPQVTPYTVRDANGNTSIMSGAQAIASGPGNSIITPTGSNTDLGLTRANRTDLQRDNLALKQFKDSTTLARGIAQKDPTLFGTTGNVRRLAQDVWQQVANVKQLSPQTTLQDAYSETFAKAAQNGITLMDPTTFDPNLSDITTIAELLSYNAAEALAGQQGRSVSDADVKRFRDIIGNPTAWTSSQQTFLAKLDLIDKIVDMRQGRIEGALGAQPAQPGAAPTATPAAPAERKILGETPDGRIVYANPETGQPEVD